MIKNFPFYYLSRICHLVVTLWKLKVVVYTKEYFMLIYKCTNVNLREQ